MPTLSTTKMSSKGQVVIPEDVRLRLQLQEGTQFVVVAEGDVVILKAIKAPPMEDFDALLKKARRQAQTAGMARSDVKKAIVQARRKK